MRRSDALTAARGLVIDEEQYRVSRRKLQQVSRDGDPIQSIYGVGYKLELA